MLREGKLKIEGLRLTLDGSKTVKNRNHRLHRLTQIKKSLEFRVEREGKLKIEGLRLIRMVVDSKKKDPLITLIDTNFTNKMIKVTGIFSQKAEEAQAAKKAFV